VLLAAFSLLRHTNRGHLADIGIIMLVFLLRGCELLCQRGRPATAPNDPSLRGRLSRCAHGDQHLKPCNVLTFGMLEFHDDFGLRRRAFEAPLLSVDFGQLPRTKTDATNGGSVRTIARGSGPFCAVAAASRLTDWHRAFLYDTGRRSVGDDPPRARSAVPLASSPDCHHHSAHELVHVLNAVAAELGYNIHITAHSFRATGATWMAARGCSAAQIKHWGRWSSDAFLIYLRASTEEAMAIARAFAVPAEVCLQIPTAASLLARLGPDINSWGDGRRVLDFAARHRALHPQQQYRPRAAQPLPVPLRR
jgi:hypothetical protein